MFSRIPPAKPKKNSKEYSFVYNNGKDPSARDDTRVSQPPPQPRQTQTTPATTIDALFGKLSKRHDQTDKKIDDTSKKSVTWREFRLNLHNGWKK